MPDNHNAQKPNFRPARKDDCLTIAQLYSISSDGVADYIWTQLAEPNEDILQVGARRYAREDTEFSYQNCMIAELDKQAAGMMVAFPMLPGEPDQGESDPILEPYHKLEQPGSLYICGVALFPEFRNQGIGSRFIELAENLALTQKLKQLSLIVFEKNTGAKRLYERCGFYEVMREPVVPHPLIHYDGDALLMLKDL